MSSLLPRAHLPSSKARPSGCSEMWVTLMMGFGTPHFQKSPLYFRHFEFLFCCLPVGDISREEASSSNALEPERGAAGPRRQVGVPRSEACSSLSCLAETQLGLRE